MNLDRRYLTIIITFFAVSAVLIISVVAWRYFTSLHGVTFTIQPANLTADIYRLDQSVAEDHASTKIQTVKNGQKVTLQEGKYYATVRDKKYNPEHIAFDVIDKDLSVTIKPAYSSEYLTALFKKELPVIKQAILTKYPAVATQFTLNDGALYLDGTWYGTTIKQHNPIPSENGDIYRAVLHKVNGMWQFAATPQIVLSAPENPGIPKEVLGDLNSQDNPEN